MARHSGQTSKPTHSTHLYHAPERRAPEDAKVICDNCPICDKPIGPVKLNANDSATTHFTKFQMPSGHMCFGYRPSVQCKGPGPWTVTLNQRVKDDDGNKSEISHTVTLRRYTT